MSRNDFEKTRKRDYNRYKQSNLLMYFLFVFVYEKSRYPNIFYSLFFQLKFFIFDPRRDFHVFWEFNVNGKELFRKENADVVGDKPVKNDAREMSMSDDSKQKAWLEHYQRLLNAEFDWDPNICLMNRQWKDHQSQSPLIWLRRLSLR